MKQYANALILLSIALLLCGCSTLTGKVRDLADSHYYKEAAVVLANGKAKIDKSPSLKAIKDYEAAKDLLRREIEKDYSKGIESQKAAGCYRKALELAAEAVALCPWSESLSGKLADLDARVAALDSVEEKWQGVSSQEIAERISELRSDLADVRGMMADSPKLKVLNEGLSQAIYLRLHANVPEMSRSRDAALDARIDEDFSFLFSGSLSYTSMLKCLGLVRDALAGKLSSDIEASWKAIGNASLLKDPHWGAISSELETAYIDWIAHVFAPTLSTAPVDPARIEYGESLMRTIPDLATQSAYVSSLALAHFNRALVLNHGGVGSLMASIHLNRAGALDPGLVVGVAAEGRKAATYLKTAQLPQAVLHFSIDPRIELDSQATILDSYIGDFLSRSRPGKPWVFSGDASMRRVEINIDSGMLVFPDYSKLNTKSSTYLDHFDTVPNPVKDSLKWQISWEESSVNSAKWQYNSAVSSYNISPSDWALNSVNSAYNAYKYAVNSYNQLVDRYNMTPSTIQQPSYLAYSFREGNLSMGFSLAVSVSINGKKVSFSKASIDSAYTRIGTKYTDRNEVYRRDVPWPYSFTESSFLAHVDEVFNSIARDIYKELAGIAYDFGEELGDAERKAL